jgi:hypothetical protein
LRSSSLPRRALLGAVLSLSLIGAGVAAFAADVTAGCSFTDPTGDSAVGGAPGTGDPDLDITAAGISSDATAVTGVIKVDVMDAGTANYPGDQFEFGFTVNKKAILIGAYRNFTTNPVTYAKVDGTTTTATSLKAVYDLKASTFSISISMAELEKLAGAPLAGASLTALKATSYADFVQRDVSADTAAPKDATTAYALGSSGCSAAPAPASSGSPAPSGSPSPKPSSSPSSDTATATITISAPARIHTSDPEPVLVTFKDGNGKPQSGKRITAQVGTGKAVAGTTNSSGQVRLSPIVIDRAGTRALVVRYAGSSDGSGKAEKRQNITVLAEVSKIATKSTGTGSMRTFIMTLTDDDATRHPYAGAKLTVAYSGRSVTVTTDRSGRATLTLRSGTHVDIRYAGRSGYVAAGTARTTA